MSFAAIIAGLLLFLKTFARYLRLVDFQIYGELAEFILPALPAKLCFTCVIISQASVLLQVSADVLLSICSGLAFSVNSNALTLYTCALEQFSAFVKVAFPSAGACLDYIVTYLL